MAQTEVKKSEAKKNDIIAVPVNVVKSAEAARDDVNKMLEGAESGEEISRKKQKEALARREEDAIQAAIAANRARLDKVVAAKAEDFEAPITDFWKPTVKGEYLQGIFVGTSSSGRFKQHCILVRKDGKDIPMRMLGTHKLSRELAKYDPGTALRVEFNGSSRVDSGKFHDFIVSVLKD